MPEAQATPAKQRRWLTVSAKITAGAVREQRHQRADKLSPMQRASEWLQDSRKESWRGFIDGLRVEAGKCCLGLPKTVKSVSDGGG